MRRKLSGQYSPFASWAMLLLSLTSLDAAPAAIQLNPDKDNCLIESETGSLSNGAGAFFFVGTTGQTSDSIRRGLLHFNLSAIPAGSTITSVTLQLDMNKAATLSGQSVSLHRVSADWGEGTSNATGQEGSGAASTTGDATWQHRFFNTTFWINDGGDFTGIADASQTVAGLGTYTWGSTSGMVNSVQTWLDNPSANFGWIVIGNEASSRTAKRFGSREGFPGTQPVLTVNYTEPVVPPMVDFDMPSFSVSESSAFATITVSLDKAPGTGNSASVDYSSTPGTATPGADYTSVSGTVEFGANDTEGSLQVPIVDDGTIESNETVVLTLSNPQGLTLVNDNNPATLTILSNDFSSSLVYVDFGHTGGESGTQSNPYNTLAEGLAAAAATGTIRIASGATSGSFLIDQAVRLESTGGSVRLGVADGKSTMTMYQDSKDAASGSLDGQGGESSGDTGLAALFSALGTKTLDSADAGTPHEVYAAAMPLDRGAGTIPARPDATLSVRLRSYAPFRPDTVDVSASSGTPVSYIPVWRTAQVELDDLWVQVLPVGAWPAGDIITVTANAQVDASSDEISRTVSFSIEEPDAAADGTAVRQPTSQTQGKPVMLKVKRIQFDSGTDNDAPVYHIGPEQVFETPQEVLLPLPSTPDNGPIALQYWHSGPAGMEWCPADAVLGFLVPDSLTQVHIDGSAYLRLVLHHAAIVRVVNAVP